MQGGYSGVRSASLAPYPIRRNRFVLVPALVGLAVALFCITAPDEAVGSKGGGKLRIQVIVADKGSPVNVSIKGPRTRSGKRVRLSLSKAGRRVFRGLPLGFYTVRAKRVKSAKGIARPKRPIQYFRLSKRKSKRVVKVRYGPPLVKVPFVSQMAFPGNEFFCALQANGQVSCWGDNCDGQLGDGSPILGDWGACIAYGSDYPVRVKGLSDARALSVGFSHSCAIRRSGPTVCWGFDLGSVPVQKTDLPDAEAISAGTFYTCAIRRSGQAVCWGDNLDGQLGNGSSGPSAHSRSPVEVIGLDDARKVAVGDYHSCAIRESGQAVCWGNNSSGQLGNGSSGWGADSPVPVEVVGLDDARDISVGSSHSCAIRESGQAVCWGANWAGQLGDATFSGGDPDDEKSISDRPVEVFNLGDASSISTGWGHSCALRESGQAVCWGYNENGELGIGTQGTNSARGVPANVKGLSDASMISVGYETTCAVRVSGVTVCWGTDIGPSPRDVVTLIRGS